MEIKKSECGKYGATRDGKIFKFVENQPLEVNCGNNSGYAVFSMSGKSVWAHRFVASLFIPNPENKRCINHKNGIKNDNRVENLEWCTHAENIIHARVVLGKNLMGRPARKVAQYKDGQFIRQFDRIIEAAEITGFRRQRINEVLAGLKPHHRGYTWKYI